MKDIIIKKRKRKQLKKRQPYHSARQIGGVYWVVRKRQIVACVRHYIRRRSAQIRREFIRLRSAVLGTDGQAGRREYRWSFSRNFDRPKDNFVQPAFYGRHGNGIYDYLRLLYARIGVPYCPHCGLEITKTTVDQICDRVMSLPQGTKLQILAPIVRGRKGEYAKQFEQLKRQGFMRVVVDGNSYTLDEEIKLEKNIKHNISVVVDRLVVKAEMNTRLSDSVETALKLAEGFGCGVRKRR